MTGIQYMSAIDCIGAMARTEPTSVIESAYGPR